MREITFRGKSIKSGKWVYGFYYYDIAQGSHIILENIQIPPNQNDPGGDAYNKRHEVIPKTVGQFTGLKDKKRVEIYEGDIVAGYKCAYPIEFKSGSFLWGNELLGFEIMTDCGENKGWIEEANTEISSLEIKGNIHDNPSFK